MGGGGGGGESQGSSWHGLTIMKGPTRGEVSMYLRCSFLLNRVRDLLHSAEVL